MKQLSTEEAIEIRKRIIEGMATDEERALYSLFTTKSSMNYDAVFDAIIRSSYDSEDKANK